MRAVGSGDEGRRRLSAVLGSARTKVGISQETMAMELGVARKTVQNWERGVSAPDFEQCVRWFSVLGVNPLPYLFQFLYPDLFESEVISEDNDHKSEREALFKILEEFPDETIRQLLYLLCGKHGSSPRAVMHMVNAHLQTPLKDRVTQVGVIIKNYEMNERMDSLVDPDGSLPDMEFLREAMKRGERAVLKEEKGYLMSDKKFNKK